MYPPQPPQQPYPQPDSSQQGYGQPPYGQPAYGLPPNPYAPPSTPMQPPNPYAPPSTPMQPPNPYAPPSMPMQQPMYGAPAPMAATNALNFNAFTLPQNRGSLIAAIGGIVALLSFFLFDFWGVSGSGLSFNLKATDLASGNFESLSLGHSYPLLWLVPLAALIAAAVASIAALGLRTIQGLTPRNAAVSVTAASAVGLACLLISILQFNGDIGSSNGASAAQLGISYGYGAAFWLTLLALIAALAGGIMSLRQSQPPMIPPPYMGGMPPMMPPMQ